ncbi:hypothetical protein CJU89_3836 [Yarrowia sp. B02]|nr:hypothetical protein CJU89_3836 [Yarrowia sp. B02]
MSSANLQLLKKQLFERQNKFAHLRKEYDSLLEQFDREQQKIDTAVTSFTSSIQALDMVRDNLKLQLDQVQEQQNELRELRDMETLNFYKNHNLPSNFFSGSPDKRDTIEDPRGMIRHSQAVIRDTKHAKDILKHARDTGKVVPRSGLYRKDVREFYV